MKKIITLFLVLAMVVSMFSACSNPEDPAGESTPPKAEGNSTPAPDASNKDEETEAANDYIKSGLPEGLNYGGNPIYIACWYSGQPEYEVDDSELDGDPIVDAIYKRNLYTEQLLNVELDFIPIEGAGNASEIIGWCEKAKKMMDDPNTPLDILSSYSRTGAQATVRGLNQDLTVYDNLDLTKEWWPNHIQKDFAIKDGLFFITGDISTNVLHGMYGIFYNKTLAASHGLGDLVQMVKDKEWTMDAWMNMSKNIYEDLDDVSGKSGNDFFGAGFQYYDLNCIIQGAGFKFLKNTSDGIAYSDELFTDTFGSFVNRMTKWVQEDGVFNDSKYAGCMTTGFLEGRVIFAVTAAQFGFSLQDTDIDYGILPPPMLNPEAQNYEYVTTLGNGYSIYSMSRASRDGERAAAVLQSLGYYAYTYTTPAIFDVTFQGKFSKQEDVMDMWNVIREAVGFDLGILYMLDLNSLCDIPTYKVISVGALWENVMTNRQQQLLQLQLDALNATLDDVLNS